MGKRNNLPWKRPENILNNNIIKHIWPLHGSAWCWCLDKALGFPGLGWNGRRMRPRSTVGEGEAPWLGFCLLQSPAEEILTGSSMKLFAHELHKFPDISSWSSPKNCWRKASRLGCLALFCRIKCPFLQRSQTAGGWVLFRKGVTGPSFVKGHRSSQNPQQPRPWALPPICQRDSNQRTIT